MLEYIKQKVQDTWYVVQPDFIPSFSGSFCCDNCKKNFRYDILSNSSAITAMKTNIVKSLQNCGFTVILDNFTTNFRDMNNANFDDFDDLDDLDDLDDDQRGFTRSGIGYNPLIHNEHPVYYEIQEYQQTW
jgi:hypothetical protein